MPEAVTETQAADVLTKGPAPFSLGAPESPSPEKAEPTPSLPETLAGRFDFYKQELQKIIGDLGAKTAVSDVQTAEAEKQYGKTVETVVKPAMARVKAQTEVPPPPLPKQLPVPPQPDISARPFGATEKNTLGSVVQTLGLMAQMAYGAGKAPKAALGAFTGAMTGWAEGDSIRAERDWKKYLEQVDTIRQENRQALGFWEAASRQHGQNEQAATAALSVALAEAGFAKDAITVAEKGRTRALQDFTTQAKMIDQLFGTSVELEKMRVNAEWRQAEQAHRQRMDEETRRRDEETARYHRDQLARQTARDAELRAEAKRRLDLQEAAGARAAKLAEARLGVLNMPAQAVKLAQADIGISQKLQQADRLEEAVKYLDDAGVIPKGPTLVDQLKARGALQTKVGDEEIGKQIQALNRWGTALLVSSEVSTMGGAAVLRIKSIAEAEAGKVQMVPKAFWDEFLADTRKTLNAQRTNTRTMLKAYKGAQGIISGAMKEEGIEQDIPEPPAGFKAVDE